MEMAMLNVVREMKGEDVAKVVAESMGDVVGIYLASLLTECQRWGGRIH